MKRSVLGRGLLPAAVVLSLALAACGGDDDSSGNDATTSDAADTASADESAPASDEAAAELSGTIAGAGATAQQAAQQAWVAGFAELQPGVTVNYDPIGSGGGREQFLAGGTVFAGSDAYLDDEELTLAQERCGGDPVEFPVYVSPIAVAYNLPGVDSLNLSPAAVAGIFAGTITTWNDPAIADDNPDAELPDTAVTPVHRSDDSGTTENFTDYLTQVAGDVWTFDVVETWPGELGGEAAQGTSGVVAAITAGDGYVGYADASQVGDLGVANIGVGEDFVEFSPEAAAAVLDASTRVEGRPATDIAIDVARDTTEADTYPIVLVSYAIGCLTYEDPTEAELVSAYLAYMVSAEGQDAAAENAGSAPITDTLREEIVAIIDQIG